MATPQKERLRPLTAEEQAALVALAKVSSERPDRVRRAQAVLAVARGHSFVAAARRAGFRSGSAGAGLISRFNRRG